MLTTLTWVQNYLRSYVGDRRKDLSKWIVLVEWRYYSNYLGSTKITLFEALYGNKLPNILNYVTRIATVEEVKITLQS